MPVDVIANGLTQPPVEFVWVETTIMTQFERDTLPLLFSSEEDIRAYYATMGSIHTRKTRELDTMMNQSLKAKQHKEDGRLLECVKLLRAAVESRRVIFAATDFQVTAAVEHCIWSCIHLGCLALTQKESDVAYSLFICARDWIAKELADSPRQHLFNVVLQNNWANYWMRRGKFNAASQSASKALGQINKLIKLKIALSDTDKTALNELKRHMLLRHCTTMSLTGKQAQALKLLKSLLHDFDAEYEAKQRRAEERAERKRMKAEAQARAHAEQQEQAEQSSKKEGSEQQAGNAAEGNQAEQTGAGDNDLESKNQNTAADEEEREGNSAGADGATNSAPAADAPPASSSDVLGATEGGEDEDDDDDTKVSGDPHGVYNVTEVTFLQLDNEPDPEDKSDQAKEARRAIAVIPVASITVCLASPMEQYHCDWSLERTTTFLAHFTRAYAHYINRQYHEVELAVEQAVVLADRFTRAQGGQKMNRLWWEVCVQLRNAAVEAPAVDLEKRFRMGLSVHTNKELIVTQRFMRETVLRERATEERLREEARRRKKHAEDEFADEEDAPEPVPLTEIEQTGLIFDADDGDPTAGRWSSSLPLLKGRVPFNVLDPAQRTKAPEGPRQVATKLLQMSQQKKKVLRELRRPQTPQQGEYVLPPPAPLSPASGLNRTLPTRVGATPPSVAEQGSRAKTPQTTASGSRPTTQISAPDGRKPGKAEASKDSDPLPAPSIDDILNQVEDDKKKKKKKKQVSAAEQVDGDGGGAGDSASPMPSVANGGAADADDDDDDSILDRTLDDTIAEFSSKDTTRQQHALTESNLEEHTAVDEAYDARMDRKAERLSKMSNEMRRKMVAAQREAEKYRQLEAQWKEREAQLKTEMSERDRVAQEEREQQMKAGVVRKMAAATTQGKKTKGKAKPARKSILDLVSKSEGSASQTKTASTTNKGIRIKQIPDAADLEDETGDDSAFISKVFRHAYHRTKPVPKPLQAHVAAGDASTKRPGSGSVKSPALSPHSINTSELPAALQHIANKKNKTNVAQAHTNEAGVVVGVKRHNLVPQETTLEKKQKTLRAMLPSLPPNSAIYREIVAELSENEALLEERRQEKKRLELEQNAERLAKKVGMLSAMKTSKKFRSVIERVRAMEKEIEEKKRRRSMWGDGTFVDESGNVVTFDSLTEEEQMSSAGLVCMMMATTVGAGGPAGFPGAASAQHPDEQHDEEEGEEKPAAREDDGNADQQPPELEQTVAAVDENAGAAAEQQQIEQPVGGSAEAVEVV